MRSAQPRNTQLGVTQPTHEGLSGPTLFSRLLDGAHPWGSFDALVHRYGVRRYRLTIYPPGSSSVDHRLARLWRGWPLTGAVLGLVALILLGNVVASPDTVLAVAVAAYVGIGVVLFLRAGPVRMQVRSMSITLMQGIDDECERRKYIEWKALVHMLTRADHMLTTGAISFVEHEATWWKAYDRLQATTNV
jgi:hypothetical protein